MLLLILQSSAASGSDGAGTAAGVATVSGVGASTAAAAGSSAGVATVAGIGSTAGASGTSAGVATVSGVGASTAAAAGSSAGVATVAGVGSTTANVQSGAGSSAGVATVSGVGAPRAAAAGSSSGLASVSGVGASFATQGAGAAAGSATVIGISSFDAVGTEPSDEAEPVIEVMYSEDGGATWSNPRIARVGRQGERRTRVMITRLGVSGEDGRIWRFRMSASVAKGLTGASVDVVKLRA